MKTRTEPKLCTCYANAKAHSHVSSQGELDQARRNFPHTPVVHEPACDCFVCMPAREGMEGL